MKGLPFAIQCLSILAGLAILVVVAKLKKNKVMKVSIWILLEFSVVGALLIHVSVILDYFEATPIICLMIPWCREIGFVLLYGSLILKIQRTLTEFQSRKAHRVQWPDKDLIRCLIIMATILALHMAAWTASVCDNLSFAQLAEDIRIDIKKPFSSFSMLCRKCYFSIKDRILEGGELVFLGYSLYMCYKVRKAPNEYHENKFITFCILNELLTSALYYSIRYFAGSTWLPDQIFLASFIKCHLTVTLAIILVVCSKLWYSCWPPSAEYRTRSCSSAPSVDSRSVQFLNPSSPPPSSPPVQFEPTKSDSNNLDETDISQMTSEDIRYELRKLYTQLQIYKTKTMRLDNPHISRRRGGKKQPNRKFSFQNLHAKYRQQSSVTSTNAAATTPSGSVGGGTSMAGDHCENSTVTGGGEIDLSVRSPEDSSNSMEGVSVYMDENSYASPEINTSSGKDCYAAKKQQNAFKSILTAARNKTKHTN
ncbi:hypothetical protein HELRODRAFT_94059 [Helobdella robusta]|uniref:G-protein coupled receptors family 3 profile domain-containing protein n=1 Tax=Helobdella robusta TaxID=6412 RepID=T1G8Y7_HELRO|nr:hypothetical protein HELRODRAFT_94059 [Helobdella robusta]ESO06421.1 hypothetical protein HELRODRAFT_94059 [Helobdella robusta]